MARARVGRRTRARRLSGDKGYSHRVVRAHLHGRCIKPVIVRRAGQVGRPGRPAAFDRAAYRRRNVVERCVNAPKEGRRLGTRPDKQAPSYRGSCTWR